MNSIHDLELHLTWRRESLLAEAEAERLARQLRGPRRSLLRARMAAALYALADRLSPEAAAPALDTLSGLEPA